LRTHLLLTPRGSETCCRSSDLLLLMPRSRAGAWSAPRLHIIRCHLRGEELRSKSRLPGRSLLPSSTLEHVSVIRSSRTFDRSAHQYFRSGSRDPPDLGANNPTRSGPCDPAAKPGFLSWGCPKIAPPSYRSRNPTPRDVLPRAPVCAGLRGRAPRTGVDPGGTALGASFEMRTPIPIRVPPAWFFATSTVYSSSTTRPYCRSLPILGFTAFPPVAKQDFPPCTCCPSKPSLRRQRRFQNESWLPWARVTASTVSGRCVHREPCLLALSLSL